MRKDEQTQVLSFSLVRMYYPGARAFQLTPPLFAV